MVENKKLICYSTKYSIYSKGAKLYIKNDIGGTLESVSYLPVSFLKRAMSSIRIMSRALRLEPRCGIFADDTIALISFHGAIYRVDCAHGTVQLEHSFRPEMKNPLNFVRIEDVPDFTNGIYYGEYYLNNDSKEVSIYRRNPGWCWEKVYTFEPGEIYHVHAIVPCKAKECVYVLTGDKDNESGIYRFKNDFKEVSVIANGSQSYRACVALPTGNGLLYVTDTPLKDNYLYELPFDFDPTITKPLPITKIAGPCIYGRVLSGNEMVFSTSVEPDSRIKGLWYNFTSKLGSGVKDRRTHLYYVRTCKENEIVVKELFAAEKDIWPMGACQFGTLMFPEGPRLDGEVLVTGQAIRKYDNKTFSIDLRELQ